MQLHQQPHKGISCIDSNAIKESLFNFCLANTHFSVSTEIATFAFFYTSAARTRTKTNVKLIFWRQKAPFKSYFTQNLAIYFCETAPKSLLVKMDLRWTPPHFWRKNFLFRFFWKYWQGPSICELTSRRSPIARVICLWHWLRNSQFLR